MIRQSDASVGARSGLPVTKVIHRLCRGRTPVSDVDVMVTDVDSDGTTLVDIVATVGRSLDIPITRAIIRDRLGHTLLSKDTQFNLLVRERGLAGDVAETIWRFSKNVVVSGSVDVRETGRDQIEV